MANVASNIFSAPAKTFSMSSIFGSPAQNALTKLKTGGATTPSVALQSKAPVPAGMAGMNTPTGVKYVPLGGSQPVAHPAAPVATPTTSTYTAPSYTAPVSSSFAPKSTVSPVQTQPQTTVAPKQATAPLSFQGLVGNIGTAAQGVTKQSGLINNTAGLIGSQGQMTQEETDARQKLAQLKKVESDTITNIESHPSDMAFQMGREAVAGRNLSAQKGSLADQIAAYAAERSANTQAYQGQATAQQGAGSLLQGAGALQTGAAGLAQPQLGAYGQNYYNPLNADQGGQGGDISGVIGQYAEGLRNGTLPYSAIPSTITGNPILAAQLFQSAGGSNFNLNTSLGASAAQQSNTQLGGTAIQGANASVYQQALPAYYEMQSQLQNVEGLGSLLLSTANGGQINPFAPQFANLTVGQLRNQLSDQDQVRFNSTLASFQGAASQLLANSSGQIPTDVSHNISLLASGNLQLGALKAMVDQAQKEGRVKLTNQGNIVNSALQTLQQGTGGGGNDPLGIL